MAKLTNVKTVDMVNGEITKVAYDGVEYAKVDGSAKIGDLVLCLNNTPFFTVGEFYFAWDLYEGGEPRMEDDAGDNYHMRPNCRALFRKISAPTLEERVSDLETEVASLKGEKANETIEFEGATYRKVEREAREGDVVIFSEEIANQTTFVTANKPYKVAVNSRGTLVFTYDRVGTYQLYRESYGRTRETVDVYEPIEQAKYVPQEGDIVVVTANASSHANSIGDIGKVGKEEPLDDGGVNVYVPGGPSRAIRTKPCDIRKATPAEVEKYEQAVKDAEIAEKWANIGRKPNEFKKGDVVRVLGTCNGHEIAGQLGEVVEPDGTDRPFVRAVYSDELVSLYSRIELVAPVESLFNA